MPAPTIKELPAFFVRRWLHGFPTPTSPHMDPETIGFLRERLATAKLYVEFGSGGSTILADRMGVRTISVESDRVYAAAVRRGLVGSTVTIVTPSIGLIGPWGYPVFRRMSRSRLVRWRRYVEAPFVGDVPDLVLVDGRFRVACALETARRVVEHGGRTTLIIDDYERRERYRVVERYLGAPRRIGRSAVFEIVGQAVPWLPIADVH